jgi:hypothetical protein
VTLLTARSCRHAALAQLVEHRIRNAGVTGSSPVGGTTQSTVSQTHTVSIRAGSFPPQFWRLSPGPCIAIRARDGKVPVRLAKSGAVSPPPQNAGRRCDADGDGGSDEPEGSPLGRPCEGEITHPQQAPAIETGWLVAVEDGVEDVRSEPRQPDQLGDMLIAVAVDTRFDCALDELAAGRKRMGDHAEKCRITACVRAAAIRRDRAL